MKTLTTAFGPALIIGRMLAASTITPKGRPMIKILITAGPEAGKTTWIPAK